MADAVGVQSLDQGWMHVDYLNLYIESLCNRNYVLRYVPHIPAICIV